jgi:transposase
VLTALIDYPRITPVWLPTYAPWLNPIEKLWHWLRQAILKLPRWVEDWPQVKGVVSILNILLGGKTDRFAQRA